MPPMGVMEGGNAQGRYIMQHIYDNTIINN